MSEHTARLTRLYVSYSVQDEKLLKEFNSHLSTLRRLGIFDIWVSQGISTASSWDRELLPHLNSAQIILFLVSPDFLASGYCYSEEVHRALERHEMGETRIIPILLRPVDWEETPLAHLQVLPRDAIAVTLWKRREEAWINIINTLRFICGEQQKASKYLYEDQEAQKGRLDTSTQQSTNTFQLFNVFVKSGVPSITFVERENFVALKLALAQPGRGIIIEGPSGVGKTTAVKKAIENLSSDSLVQEKTSHVQITMLSARKPEDQNKLKSLPTWHNGTIVIDDFHRLSPMQRNEVADYLKYLADTEPLSKKLVIIGIPQTGQTLVDASFDLATRIDVFKLGPVEDDLVIHMIEKGEKALNIEFADKNGVAFAANGSLNIAQFLCFDICQKAGVTETLSEWRKVSCDIDAAGSSVITSLSRKFAGSIKQFAALGGHEDTICLKLLQELARSESGFLSLSILKSKKPTLANGIDRLISNKWLDKFYNEHPESVNHLYFDSVAQALVVDDTQFLFYLKRLRFSVLAKEVGKVDLRVQQKAFISYSHDDAEWHRRLQVHLKPLEREGIIDLWDDTKLLAGTRWEGELQYAIQSAKIAVILISASFLASDFINEYELPALLSRAAIGGTIILPLIISPCMLTGSGLEIFQSINPLNNPLTSMNRSEQEQTLVDLTLAVRDRLMSREN